MMRQVFNNLARKGRKAVGRTVMGGVPAFMLAMGAAGMVHAGEVTTNNLPANDIPQRVLEIHDNAADICAPVSGPGGAPAIRARVQGLTGTLSRSETGASLVEFAGNGPAGALWICFIDDIKNMGQYRSGYGVMDLPAEEGREHLVGTSAHEIRHYWQEAVGYGIFENDDISKKADTILTLAAEADADAIATRVMWELKQKGITGDWDFHMDRANCEGKVCRDDILKAFESAIAADADALDNGKALADAFAQWYEDKTRSGPYLMRVMMKYSQRRMSDIHGHDLNEAENPGYLGPIESPVSKHIRDGEIEGIAALPHKGTNYLDQQGGYLSVMKDARKSLKPYKPKS